MKFYYIRISFTMQLHTTRWFTTGDSTVKFSHCCQYQDGTWGNKGRNRITCDFDAKNNPQRLNKSANKHFKMQYAYTQPYICTRVFTEKKTNNYNSTCQDNL